MRTHELKCWPDAFAGILSGEKTHEYRRDDRDYRPGDVLLLREWDPNRIVLDPDDTDESGYTGRSVSVLVTWASRHAEFGVPAGFVVLSVRRREG